MYKGRKHAGTIISTIIFLVLLLTTQTSANRSIVGYLKCFGVCAGGCITLPTSVLKGFCVGNCIHKCIFTSNKLQGIDYCKPVCIHEKCIHHLTEVEDLKKEDIDKYVNCVGECDKQIGECDRSSQLKSSPVGDVVAP